MSSLATVVRLRFSSLYSCLISFVMIVKRKSIVIAPAPSLMTCQFRRVRRKKVTLEWPSIILTLCAEMEPRLIAARPF